MEKINELVAWFLSNKQNIAEAVGIIMMLASFVVRLTPTQNDDGFFAKVDKWVNKIFDLLKIPNVKKPEVKEENK